MKTEIKIGGMSCMHCVASVKSALEELCGVEAVDVSLENACASVEYDDKKTDLAEMKSAIEDIGFDVE